MKQYQPKFSECPYKSSNGSLCSHKLNGKYCGHKQTKNCLIYLEWLEMKNVIEYDKSLTTDPLKPLKRLSGETHGI